MRKDIIIGLDSSTQSTKAIAWSVQGEALAEGRADIALHTPQAGRAEQSTNDWWIACCTALQAICKQIDPRRISGLAVSNQRETVCFLDEQGEAVHPAIVWLDERATDQLAPVTKALGKDFVHSTTGKPMDITPVIYRLSWLKQNNPDVLKRSAKILDVHGFLTGKLIDHPIASWTSADPFGLFDLKSKQWSPLILDYLGLRAEQFGTLHAPGAHLGVLTHQAAEATGLQSGTSVYSAGGDGQCAGLGVNAVRKGVIYLNLGTAIITGAWSANADINTHWRTMTSPTGEGYFLEGVQRAGAFFINWFVDRFAGGRGDSQIFQKLEAQAIDIPIGSQGVLVCPYLTGCMDPHWDPLARATFTGLGPMHDQGHLYRASLEALTLEITRCIEAMRENGIAPERILAVGGGANSTLWSKMIADSTGLPLTRSKSLEASSLGAAMSAAVGSGWFSSFGEAAAAMSADGDTLEPDPAAVQAWAALSQRQTQVYFANR